MDFRHYDNSGAMKYTEYSDTIPSAPPGSANQEAFFVVLMQPGTQQFPICTDKTALFEMIQDGLKKVDLPAIAKGYNTN
jgi:hypothetical protein